MRTRAGVTLLLLLGLAFTIVPDAAAQTGAVAQEALDAAASLGISRVLPVLAGVAGGLRLEPL